MKNIKVYPVYAINLAINRQLCYSFRQENLTKSLRNKILAMTMNLMNYTDE